jgi:hypothetical protein
MEFEVLTQISNVEIIAVGSGIRELPRLARMYGKGRWRKLKGTALIRLNSGETRRAELHWYEAHGIGKRDLKIKRYTDEP